MLRLHPQFAGDMPAARATLEAVLVDRRRIQAHGGILDDMQLAGSYV